MPFTRPSSKEHYCINLMSSVSWEFWTNVQRLCCVTNEQLFQDHHWKYNSTGLIRSASLNSCLEASLFAFYKTIFWVSLSYQLNKLCLLGDLNEHTGTLLCHQQMSFSIPSFEYNFTDSKRSVYLRHEQMFTGLLVHSLQDHLQSKPMALTIWDLSPRNTWTLNMKNQGFPSVTEKLAFSRPSYN